MPHDLLATASLDETKKGYIEQPDHFVCLFCGRKIEKGVIYPDDGILYEASRYIRIHIEQAHGSVFASLIRLGKKATSLSEHQNRLLELFYQGKSDAEVQDAMNIGSASTIRNHRFALREKERQAKILLAMMELLKKKEIMEIGQPNKKEAKKTMDKERRKELQKQYQEVEIQAGVYQIRNTKNNKVFIETTPNLKTMTGAPGPLSMGRHRNRQLQSEWNEYGQEAFAFEVLEVLKKKDEGYFDLQEELRKLEQKWLEQLQPYGERGYHQPKDNQ